MEVDGESAILVSHQWCLPGQPLAKSKINAVQAGPGTYNHDRLVCASIAGNWSQKQDEKNVTIISVDPPVARKSQNDVSTSALPEKEAAAEIIAVYDSACKEEFQAVIRVQDVRATERDKVRIHQSFRPGDIVRAQVISLGDQRNYYLSTARNDLGVIFATSIAGEKMYPIDYSHMGTSQGEVEERKCAKPV